MGRSRTLVTFKSQQNDSPEKERLRFKKMAVMKTTLTAIIGLCMVTFSGAFPQNNPSDISTTTLAPLPDGCHYEYHEFIDLIDVEIIEKKCFEVGKCECVEKSESICLPYTEDQSI